MDFKYFLDNASTTKCSKEAASLLTQFATEFYGNPSSSHSLGNASTEVIRKGRHFFAHLFHIDPTQVIFTGSGTESDNLAITGVAMAEFMRQKGQLSSPPPRIIVSAIEHPAVKKSALSLQGFGFEVKIAPVDSNGQIQKEAFIELLSPTTLLVSIHQVNNIIGALLPVDDLAQLTKKKVPQALFHTDAVQAFGKINVPDSSSAIDLVSISGHKVRGPKGVGALLILKSPVIPSKLRPLIWGGNQEEGFRAGTQNAGLIAGFHVASQKTLIEKAQTDEHILEIYKKFFQLCQERKWIRWNSPPLSQCAIPHIVNISVPGVPAAPLVRLLEERGFLVSTGSACHSHHAEPDPVLEAIGLPLEIQKTAMRVSFSAEIPVTAIDLFFKALEESVEQIQKLTTKRLKL